MKRKIAALLIVAATLLSILSVPVGAAVTDGVAYTAFTDYYGRSALSKMKNSAALLYAYDNITTAVAKVSSPASVYDGTHKITVSEVRMVYDTVIRDRPEFFWIDPNFSYSHSGSNVLSVVPQYNMKASEVPAAKKKLASVADGIISKLNPSMSDLDKELYFHTVVAKSATYDLEGGVHIHDAYGALVENVAVCDGYAKAFEYLLHRTGVPAFEAIGTVDTDGGHAWTYVKLYGEWYHTDVTWDDPNDSLVHTYLNVTDAVIAADHTVIQPGYALPVCSATLCYYKNIKGIILANVTEIASFEFRDFKTVSSVTIPDSVKKIGFGAFDGCTSLKNLDLGHGVETIDDWAFVDCTSLTDLVIPDSVTSIGMSSFAGCDALQSIKIGSGLTALGLQFANLPSLKDVTIGSGVTSIGANAFRNCTSLTAVTIPDNVTAIDPSAFYGCSSLETVVIGDGVGELGGDLFFNLRNLKNVTLGDGIKTVGEQTFAGCSSIEEIVLPEGVETIGKGAFQGCSSLKSMTVPEGVETIDGYTFRYCSALESLYIPLSVTSIERDALYGCNALTDVYFAGTKQEWELINIDNGLGNRSVLSRASIHFLGEPLYIVGDADGDGNINMKDVLFLRRAIAGAVQIDDDAALRADVDSNGDLNMKDVLMLRQIIAGAN